MVRFLRERRILVPNTEISFSYDFALYTAFRRSLAFGGSISLARRTNSKSLIHVEVFNEMLAGSQKTSSHSEILVGTRNISSYICKVYSKIDRTDLKEEVETILNSFRTQSSPMKKVLLCPHDIRGSSSGDERYGFHAIIDLLLGPVPEDLHLDAILIRPGGKGTAGEIVYQARSLWLL